MSAELVLLEEVGADDLAQNDRHFCPGNLLGNEVRFGRALEDQVLDPEARRRNGELTGHGSPRIRRSDGRALP